MSALIGAANAICIPPKSALPQGAAGTLALQAVQSRIPLALTNHYPAGSPLWHLFNNFYRHALNRVEREWGQPVEIQHE